jgi:glycosyltransferase involved in cell wall biosynthesis
MMRVAYVYDLAADDVMVQSGRPSSILRQLGRLTELEAIFPLNHWVKYAFAPKYAFYKMRKRTYRADREPAVLQSMARQIERRLRGKSVDRIFAPGSHVLSCLETDVPKVLCADATFASVVDRYGEFLDCAPEYLRQGHAQEAQALAKCAAVIFPSEWAARSAIEDYGVDRTKIHIVPFGANLDVPAAAAVEEAIEAREFNRLRVLFIGRDWQRKGGELMLEAAAIAQRNGVPFEIDIVGPSRPPADLPDYVRYHGLLMKSVPSDRLVLGRLMREAHILFVPSRAENFGMTFCEAAAFGIPSLSTSVGGIPTIVRPGISGWCLPIEADACDYAEILGKCYADPAEYRQLARSARAFYDANLTWDAFGERLIQILT